MSINEAVVKIEDEDDDEEEDDDEDEDKPKLLNPLERAVSHYYVTPRYLKKNFLTKSY